MSIPTSHDHNTNQRGRRRRNQTQLDPAHSQLRDTLRARLDNVSLSDARVFGIRLKKARSLKALCAIENDITRAEKLVHSRSMLVPDIVYPASLPVSGRRDDIAAAIRDHQVVIIAGETGSGKTTQLPKICLDLGRGRRGLIGHTQPRRLAARTVAERIAQELGQRVGETVGYAIRYDDSVGPATAVKLMTDGILLAEMQRDRYLNNYDTIIIDEAHERSLNIDFLLGYLKQLLPKRPDLKVIITSATIDPERFARHFGPSPDKPAPIIEVSGRIYPVDILYRPLELVEADRTVEVDPLDGLLLAIEELMGYGEGDILCFFAGEADIREALEAIEGRGWPRVEVVPLFGRLSNNEQHKVFSPHSIRRIVLATNIAETSLTVPGIHYVIDTGTARISRYSVRTKVQRLPIEPISQASANQRSGRCGRVADGVAIRLYSEQDFQSRPEFTDPEILRTNLASVILQMSALDLGDIEEFPFIEAPDTKAIRDGVLLLHELNALEQTETANGSYKLTPIGRDVARIPLDPRMARMLVEAYKLGCLKEALIVVAAMSIQEIRERPLDSQAQADQLHARFKDKKSDFSTYLNLWEYLATIRQELSGNQFRKRVSREYLNYMRIREWFDLVHQLINICSQLGWNLSTVQELSDFVRGKKQGLSQSHDLLIDQNQTDALHQSLLSGLLSHIGIRELDSKEYRGSRNTRFMIFPGSALSSSKAPCVMAGELVETSRLWARDVAELDPRWVEKLGGPLLKHQYSEPHWSAKKTAAMAYQKSTLYGVPVVIDRLVPYHRVDLRAARDIFIRHALVQGEWTTHHSFFHENREKLDRAQDIESRARRRDIVVDEDTLFDFYEQRIPEHIASGRSFDNWWKRNRAKNPHLLDFDPENLVNEQARDITEDLYPSFWHLKDMKLELSYEFDPGSHNDGLTVYVPVPLLAGLDPDPFQWLVPGLREELITELIRSLPKPLRRQIVPAPEFAKKVLPLLDARLSTPLTAQLSEQLGKLDAQGLSPSAFDWEKVPDHLKVNYAAIDRRGKVIDHDRNLTRLKKRRSDQIKSSVANISQNVNTRISQTWAADTLGTIAEEAAATVDGLPVTTYPALVVTEKGVAIQAMGTRAEAEQAMMTSTMTLLMRAINVNDQRMLNGLSLKQRVAVENYPHGGSHGLVNDARIAAIRDALIDHGGPVRDPERYQQLEALIRNDAPSRVRRMIVDIAPGLVEYLAVSAELHNWTGEAIEDMRKQLAFLLPAQALTIYGIRRLRHLPRYLKAMQYRLDDMAANPDRDAEYQHRIEKLEDQLSLRIENLPPARRRSREVKDIQWLIQELRVSFFAQRLGTAEKVSEAKISKAITRLT
ncbi:ATP-dependent RNA helicase HrpA [Corynebacterium sp. ES2794-CONJ1]|uniref:ATP-dependent RNA helicase HrpA n=1 Tax=Corynebacterium sp. ES2794-CONJ1 TaxID=2980553 RepID=UPI0021DAE536|nr:ATP-dependent RNA helicase HrpA [Corynebacterium sp. ES2794-CONJ1]MCU9518495.1 ATP-dependent RNA helicase HrpA [Corynebacterium sp. ES2794-CONJ1]